jgi:hypothetical protein
VHGREAFIKPCWLVVEETQLPVRAHHNHSYARLGSDLYNVTRDAISGVLGAAMKHCRTAKIACAYLQVVTNAAPRVTCHAKQTSQL